MHVARAILGLPFRIAGHLQRRRIIVYYIWPDFARKAAGIADLLRRRGFDVVLRTGRSPFGYIRTSTSRDLWIGFWNEYRTDYMPANYIFFNGEQLSMPHWSSDDNWARGMRNAIEVWDYSRSNEQYVTPLGVPFRYVPFGYAPFYEESFRANTAGKSLVEDIDVLFVGQLTERRRLILERLQQRGVQVHSVTRDNPAHGGKLDELLARARIVLNIYSYDDPNGKLADYARLDHLLANRRFVVQERPSSIGNDPALERKVTTCAYDELADTCVRMLAQPGERRRRAEAAYQWFTSECALDSFIPYDELRERVARL